jgi:peptidoglycan/xylan/chitin deacetylase (PgdA/CDA1 family)
VDRPAGASPTAGRLQRQALYLTYHEIGVEPSEYLYSSTRDQLDEHLRVVSEFQQGKGADSLLPRVTFDDGHVSNFVHALPLLEQHTIPAIFFITTNWTGVRPDFMTWAQLRELAARGHQVQSHGWSHELLTLCSDAELEDELVRSKRALEDHVGVAVDSISLPGGRGDRRVYHACAKAGYKRVYTSAPLLGTGQRVGVEVLGRLMIRRTADAAYLRQLLSEPRKSLFPLQAQYRLTEGFKRLLGDRLYLKVWCWLAGWVEPEERR